MLSACDSRPSGSPVGTPDREPLVAPVVLDWTPLIPSVDTLNIYVSSSSGSDSNNGLTPQTPKATIQAGVQLLRQGFPDWLHVKRGDQFTGGLGDWFLSGRSALEPMVVTTYGSSNQRPLFQCGVGSGLTVHGGPISDVAFVGLHFLAHTHDGSNGQPYGVSLLTPCTRVLIEDCKIERFFCNLRFQGAGHRDLKLRRSVIIDAFTAGTAHSQGIYVEALTGCLIEECLFDHNGWNTSVAGAVANIYRHNIYVQGDAKKVVIHGNIIARGSSHGLQARSGGIVHNNLFLRNAINLLVGDTAQNNGAVKASVIGNVMLDGRNISASEPRGWAAHFQCLASGEIAYNVAAHQVSGTAPRNYDLDSNLGVGIRSVDFHHNVSYRWGAPLTLTGNRFTGLNLRNNDLQEFGNGELIRTNYGGVVAGIASANNRFHTAAQANSWMFYNSQYMSLATWKPFVGDATSIATQVAYPRPAETIANYDLLAGGSGSLESFLTRARSQSRTNWSNLHLGHKAAAYFRRNFGVVVP